MIPMVNGNSLLPPTTGTYPTHIMANHSPFMTYNMVPPNASPSGISTHPFFVTQLAIPFMQPVQHPTGNLQAATSVLQAMPSVNQPQTPNNTTANAPTNPHKSGVNADEPAVTQKASAHLTKITNGSTPWEFQGPEARPPTQIVDISNHHSQTARPPSFSNSLTIMTSASVSNTIKSNLPPTRPSTKEDNLSLVCSEDLETKYDDFIVSPVSKLQGINDPNEMELELPEIKYCKFIGDYPIINKTESQAYKLKPHHGLQARVDKVRNLDIKFANQ